jgi:hypothetical protein
MDPGSAAHHAALRGALRSIRGTHDLVPSWPGESAKRVFALDDPAIHAFCVPCEESRTWMRGTSPRMTMLKQSRSVIANEAKQSSVLTTGLDRFALCARDDGRLLVSRTRCGASPAMRRIVRCAAPQSRDQCNEDGPRISSASRRTARRAARCAASGHAQPQSVMAGLD